MDESTTLEAALARAARRYVEAARKARDEAAADAECLRVLFHLGFSRAELTPLVGGTGPLAPPLAELAVASLRRAIRRMGRLARCGSPRYDINLHIAYSRTLRRLAGPSRTPDIERQCGRDSRRRRPNLHRVEETVHGQPADPAEVEAAFILEPFPEQAD